jgi:hypothetical protein
MTIVDVIKFMGISAGLLSCQDRVLSDCAPSHEEYMASAYKKAASKCPSNKVLIRCYIFDFCQEYQCLMPNGIVGLRIDAAFSCG